MTDDPTDPDTLRETIADLEQRIIFLESEVNRLNGDSDALAKELRQTQTDTNLR